MSITVNVRDNPFHQKIFHAGAEQGKAEGEPLGLAKGREQLLRKQLARKFGPLPDWVERVLSKATLEGVLQ